jgi:aldehyde:ferredoxin oxidoreductase
MPYGYHGKILHIDLTQRTARIETPGEHFWRVYGGGGLLAVYYLLRDCAPGIDALDAANLLIFSSSVVAGHPFAGLARFTAAAKSPLTGGIGETRAEGPFGMAIKDAGIDALIFHGVADEPLSVLVENGAVSFHSAHDEWGLNVNAAADRFATRFGSHTHSAIIGPAGEQRVRFASIVTDRSYQAARMGMGAVMGAKRLKAVLLAGDQRPPVADPATCAQLTTGYREQMLANSLTRWQHDPPGFSAWVHLHGIDAALCARNYRDASFAGADAFRPELFMARYQQEGDCPGCPNRCIKFFAAEDDRFDARAGAIHQEIMGTLGLNLGLDDLETLFRANILCNDLGLDPTSLGFTLSMAAECVEVGLLDARQAMRFGEAERLLPLIEQIAHRQGFGDVLAEGARRAAVHIGHGAERFALHVKGLEMVCFEPRTQTNLALGYATAPIGPRYDICEHDWDYDTQVGWDHTLENSRTVGILERIPMNYLGADKVRNFKALAALWSAADALDFCIFAIAPTRVFSLDDMARMLAAVTGWKTSGYEVMRFGERRLHLMRAYNLREGLTAADDMLPARFYDDPIALPGGRWDGVRLDRTAFQSAVRTYYRMMGWDDSGQPTYETLLDHHLGWVVEDGHLRY